MTASIARLKTWWVGTVATRRCLSCSGVLPADRVGTFFCSAVCDDAISR